MPSDQDMLDLFDQFEQGVPILQLVRERGIANPPMLEQFCAELPDKEQLPILKKLVRIECGRMGVRGLETWEQLGRFADVLECLRKHNWIDKTELDTILFQVIRWMKAKRDEEGWKMDEAEAALMRIAEGLSRRMF